MTISLGMSIHRRMAYVEIEYGYKFEEVAAAIKSDDYFVDDETHVTLVDCLDNLKDMGHGVNMVSEGVSGSAQNQLLDFNMRINNPALTVQVPVASARASMKQQPGAYTMIEVPIIEYIYGEKDDLIKNWYNRIL